MQRVNAQRGTDACNGHTDLASNNRIGLLASLSDAQGGIETFFVGSTNNGVGTAPLPVSEPATLAQLGLAFTGAALSWRRRKV